MTKEQSVTEKSEQILKTVVILVVAWVLATWSKIFLEKGYCVLKFYLENKTFGQLAYCELLPGFYSGTALTIILTFGWFVVLIMVIKRLARARDKD